MRLGDFLLHGACASTIGGIQIPPRKRQNPDVKHTFGRKLTNLELEKKTEEVNDLFTAIHVRIKCGRSKKKCTSFGIRIGKCVSSSVRKEIDATPHIHLLLFLLCIRCPIPPADASIFSHYYHQNQRVRVCVSAIGCVMVINDCDDSDLEMKERKK